MPSTKKEGKSVELILMGKFPVRSFDIVNYKINKIQIEIDMIITEFIM